MKKIFIILCLFIGLTAKAQVAGDTTTQRTQINTLIVPNGAHLVTAQIVQNILNANQNFMGHLGAAQTTSGKFDTARIPIFTLKVTYPLIATGDSNISISPTFLDSSNIILTTIPAVTATLFGKTLNIPPANPAGSTGAIQINNGGSFSGASTFVSFPTGISVQSKVYAGVSYRGTVTNNTTGDTLVGLDLTPLYNDQGSANVVKFLMKTGYWYVNMDSLYNIGFTRGGVRSNIGGNTIVIGQNAANNVTNAHDLIALGANAGRDAINASISGFFGPQAGQLATNASASFFFGSQSGYRAVNANNSFFLGTGSGMGASGLSFSGIFGTRSGDSTSSVGILTGTNVWLFGNYITTPLTGSANMADIGNVMYITHLFGTTGGTPTGTAQTTGQVGINTSAPATSAILDLTSTTMGFLPPRMTTVQRNAISTPIAGMTLYCTDCTATDASTGVTQTYNGSTWKNFW